MIHLAKCTLARLDKSIAKIIADNFCEKRGNAVTILLQIFS